MLAIMRDTSAASGVIPLRSDLMHRRSVPASAKSPCLYPAPKYAFAPLAAARSMVAATGSSLAVATHRIIPRLCISARRLRPTSSSAVSGATSCSLECAAFHPASPLPAAR